MAAQQQAQQAQAEQAPKGKPTPLAKPKVKPQPQPQAPRPPSPPPHPLAAKKSAAAAPAEDTEVQEMRGDLKGLSASLVASKGAMAKLEAKVSQWETKLAEVRAMGDEERILMAEATLHMAKAKVAENEEAIEALDRSVRRMEVVLTRTVEKVKEEELYEVVEGEVEAEEMEEGMVKEEVEAKVVVETPARGGASGWLKGLMGSRDAGALYDLPWDPAVLAGPHPRNLDTSSSPRSPVCTIRFCWCGCTTGYWGRGVGYGWTRGGGGPPGQTLADRGGQRVLGVATLVAGAGEEMVGGAGPPQNGGEDVPVGAKPTSSAPGGKRGGGHALAIRRQLLAGAGLGGD